MSNIKQMSEVERSCEDNPEDKFGRNYQRFKHTGEGASTIWYNSEIRHTISEVKHLLDITVTDDKFKLLKSLYNTSKRLSENSDTMHAGLIPFNEVKVRACRGMKGKRHLWRRSINPLVREGYIIQISDGYYAMNPDYLICRWFYSKESQDFMYNQFYYTPPVDIYSLGFPRASITAMEVLWAEGCVIQGHLTKSAIQSAYGKSWTRRVTTLESHKLITRRDEDLWAVSSKYIEFKVTN